MGESGGYGTPQLNAPWCLAPSLLCLHRLHPLGYILVGGCSYGAQTQWIMFSLSPQAFWHRVAGGDYGRGQTDFKHSVEVFLTRIIDFRVAA